MAPTGLANSFIAAIQASLSVLLVISYGGVAAWLNLLSPSHTKAISKLCVRMFLPALLFVKIGSELHIDSAKRYLTIFIWAIICHLVSFLIGIVAHIGLGMPDWVTVALMFNNTTSYPLLLIASLDETGILQSLIVTDETTSAAVERAKSYFLVFATVSSCLTFAVGPRLIDSEHAPEKSKEAADSVVDSDESDAEVDETTGLVRSTSRQADLFSQNSFLTSNRRLSVAHPAPPPRFDRRASVIPRTRWSRLGPRTKWWLLFISDFFNPPLVGAILGVVVGLVPVLHRAFFYHSSEGGFFTAWLTSSLQNIGGLFVPLPVLVAGVSLYTSMRDSRRSGRNAVKLPWGTVIFILVMRFAIWSVVAIGSIYALAKKTKTLGDDPMLWFAMMLMPTGPPAMKLITLIQVSDAGDDEEAIIAKLLTISYVISPILSFTVVGALRATQTAMSK